MTNAYRDENSVPTLISVSPTGGDVHNVLEVIRGSARKIVMHKENHMKIIQSVVRKLVKQQRRCGNAQKFAKR